MSKAKAIEVLTPEEVESLKSLLESDLPLRHTVTTPATGALSELFEVMSTRLSNNFRRSCEAVKELDEALCLNNKIVGHGIETAKKHRIQIAKELQSKGLLDTEA